MLNKTRYKRQVTVTSDLQYLIALTVAYAELSLIPMSQLNTYFITSHAHPQLPFVRQLYHTAFPEEERRPFDELPLEADNTHLQLLLFCNSGNTPVGFASVWQFGDFCFIEHLAIDAAQRSKGYGAMIVQQLLSPDYPCLLEVEPPHDDQSEKRIRFYNRLGFTANAFPYMQPPYHKGLKPIPMILLSNPAISPTDAEAFVNQLHKEVYPTFD